MSGRPPLVPGQSTVVDVHKIQRVHRTSATSLRTQVTRHALHCTMHVQWKGLVSGCYGRLQASVCSTVAAKIPSVMCTPLAVRQRLMVFSHLLSDSTTERPSLPSASQPALGLRIPRNKAACLFSRLALVFQLQLAPSLQPFSLANQLNNSERLSIKFHHEDCVQLS